MTTRSGRRPSNSHRPPPPWARHLSHRRSCLLPARLACAPPSLTPRLHCLARHRLYSHQCWHSLISSRSCLTKACLQSLFWVMPSVLSMFCSLLLTILLFLLVASRSLLCSATAGGNTLGPTVPESIGQLGNLTHLDVSRNGIDSLGEALFGLTRLSTLVLSKNSLAELPSGVSRLVTLTCLKVGGFSFPIPSYRSCLQSFRSRALAGVLWEPSWMEMC